MSGIEEDQSKKRKELQDNLQNISNEKNKEYERQVREGFESASVTEQENKRFVEIFLPTERDEPEGAPDTLNDDKEKLSEYEPPWPSHLKTDYKAGSRAPGYAKVPETGDTSNAQENWYDDPTYYDFVDNPPRHQPSPREPPKPCTIL